MFNNGRGRRDGTYSSVVQVVPPFTKEGGFARADGVAWGPAKPEWEYTAPNKEDFYSLNISGAQRLPNGNTLICSGASRTFFEVTPDKREVWRYIMPNPLKDPDHPADLTGVFRVHRYFPNYAAFAGKDLTPGPLLTDYLKKHPPIEPKSFRDAFGNSQAANVAR